MRFFPYQLAPVQASEYAKQYDPLFAVITLLTIFFTVAVMSVVIFFAIKYKAGSKADRSRPEHENLRLEIAWSLPPLMLGLVIFAWGATLFVQQRRPPANALNIFVIGKQWMWHIQHPNGVREMNELHVPEGVPVKLTMISQDVIHAFYIPQFRIQYMVVPGRYTYEWFTATKPGRYYLFCAQHCGTQHSEMGGYVYVMSQPEYAAWLEHGGSTPSPTIQTMAQKGEELYTQYNCTNCHGPADTERAPSLVGIYNRPVKVDNGSVVTADDNYLRESIVNPYAHIVQGYTNTMPQYTSGAKGQLSEEQLQQMVEYIRSLTPGTLPAKGSPSSTPSNAGLPTGEIPQRLPATAATKPATAGTSQSAGAKI
ncbi:MAG TPA: cytochrome c oxidase subunit II [Fimbriimonadaceae bacterium]|jgi:cytochrome c oxidase subunit 2